MSGIWGLGRGEGLERACQELASGPILISPGGAHGS